MVQTQRTLDIEKVLESRSKILQDHNRIIGSNLKSVFTGSSLIGWLHENLNPNNLEREALVHLVQEELFNSSLPHQLIYAIEEGDAFKDSDKSFYRFIDDQFKEFKKDRAILNLYGNDTSTCQFFYEAEGQSVLTILEELKSIIEEIYASYLDETKTLVDYLRLEESEVFNSRLIPVVTKLAYVDLSPLLKNSNDLKAFFINIYNILTIHSVIARFRSKNKLEITLIDRADFYVSYQYNIGGHNYTLNDIAQGIFRKNNSLGLNTTSTVIDYALKTKTKNDRFSGHDARLKFVLSSLDPRIHFALNPGTISSCAIKYYTSDDIDTQLEISAIDFCDKFSKLIMENSKGFFEVHELFKFYSLDFAKSDERLMNYIWSYKKDSEEKDQILQQMDMHNLQLKYMKINWDLNKIRE